MERILFQGLLSTGLSSRQFHNGCNCVCSRHLLHTTGQKLRNKLHTFPLSSYLPCILISMVCAPGFCVFLPFLLVQSIPGPRVLALITSPLDFFLMQVSSSSNKYLAIYRGVHMYFRRKGKCFLRDKMALECRRIIGPIIGPGFYRSSK